MLQVNSFGKFKRIKHQIGKEIYKTAKYVPQKVIWKTKGKFFESKLVKRISKRIRLEDL